MTNLSFNYFFNLFILLSSIKTSSSILLVIAYCRGLHYLSWCFKFAYSTLASHAKQYLKVYEVNGVGLIYFVLIGLVFGIALVCLNLITLDLLVFALYLSESSEISAYTSLVFLLLWKGFKSISLILIILSLKEEAELFFLNIGVPVNVLLLFLILLIWLSSHFLILSPYYCRGSGILYISYTKLIY